MSKKGRLLMAKNIIDDIKARYDLITKTIEALEAKSESFPEGRINVKHHKGGVHYYLVSGGNSEKYLNKNNDAIIEQLIQKEYIQKALKVAKAEAKALKRTIDAYPLTALEDVYDTLSDERKVKARPLVTDDADFIANWMNKSYKQKSFSKEAQEFYTLKGERVRSKSEVIIADRLWANGIPYKYECPLKIINEIIHPDFTILRISDRKILYHEHCGMMDNPEYSDEMVSRVNKYSLSKIFQGDRLFLTFESANNPLDVKALDEFIKKNYR